jgi:hypothetical protein
MGHGAEPAGIGRVEIRDARRGLVRADQVELQARRAGVDDEDVQ